tara:strand:+ start:637 stop:1167 length:531 start_codon:yes stop_codon:yes gene_type:complete
MFLFLERFTKLLYILINSEFMRLLFFISIFILISNCSLNLVDDHHGVFYLDKKQKKIKVNESNTNDILSILGEPSTKSTFDEDVWIYIERKITNSHFFGKRKLIVNNVMVLDIDDNGILSKKEFYNINNMKKIDFDPNRTESITRRNFIYNFLSSMRQRVNDPLGVRKKRREEGSR